MKNASGRARARALPAVIVAGALVLAACSSDGSSSATETTEASEPTTTTTAAPMHDEDAAAGDHDHDHSEATEVSADLPTPTIAVAVHEDPMSGWNLEVTVGDFTLAPESVSTDHVDGEGHLHLYIDGEKITRLYGPWYFLGDLEPGEHEIRVELSSNDHSALAKDGVIIDDTVTITVPGAGDHADDGMDHSHGS